jgi:Mrp family chromosome partitioning ATPase
MPVLNRALHKAYTRRSMTEPAPIRPLEPAASGGWAEKLRPPIGTVGSSPERPTEEPANIPAAEAALQWSWPPIVDQLLSESAGTAVRQLADQLKHQGISRKLRSIAFCGTGRNAGRSSLVLALAKVLATELATRVVLVDADFLHPDLASAISLQPLAELWTPSNGQAPVSTALKQLIPGKLSFVPLAEFISPESLDDGLVAAIHSFWRSLTGACDLVLIDVGPWESRFAPALIDSRAMDACVGVCPFHDPPIQWPDSEQLRHPGIEWLGVVETFVPRSQLSSQRA